MHEFDLYIPLSDNDGAPIADEKIEGIKLRLRERFGGFTHFPQAGQGEWKAAGQIFRDKIVIMRVLATGGAQDWEWMRNLKGQLIEEFGQADFLITARPVERV